MYFIQILFILAVVTIKTGNSFISSHGKIILCPFRATSLLGSDTEFNVETANFNLCTHAICAITWNRLQDPWSNEYGDKFARTFVNLRRRFSHLKIILSVYNLPNGDEINSMYQELFVKTVTDFISRFQFNGLEVNLDYTKQSECSPQVQKNILHLAESLRNKLLDHSLLFSFVATENILLEAHDYVALSKHLDYLNFMVNDDFDAFQNKFTKSDILNAKSVSHVESTFDHIMNSGVSPKKLLLGLRFGGTEFKNLEDTNNVFHVINNDLGYNEFCHLLLSNATPMWERSFDADTSLAASRIENDRTGEIRVIVFDSSRSVANKIDFAMDIKLAGIKTGLINSDDTEGSCELDQDTFYDFQFINFLSPLREDTTFPLLRTINDVISMKTPKIPDEEKLAYTSEGCTFCVIFVIFVVCPIIIIGLVIVVRKYWK